MALSASEVAQLNSPTPLALLSESSIPSVLRLSSSSHKITKHVSDLFKSLAKAEADYAKSLTAIISSSESILPPSSLSSSSSSSSSLTEEMTSLGLALSTVRDGISSMAEQHALRSSSLLDRVVPPLADFVDAYPAKDTGILLKNKLAELAPPRETVGKEGKKAAKLEAALAKAHESYASSSDPDKRSKIQAQIRGLEGDLRIQENRIASMQRELAVEEIAFASRILPAIMGEFQEIQTARDALIANALKEYVVVSNEIVPFLQETNWGLLEAISATDTLSDLRSFVLRTHVPVGNTPSREEIAKAKALAQERARMEAEAAAKERARKEAEEKAAAAAARRAARKAAASVPRPVVDFDREEAGGGDGGGEDRDDGERDDDVSEESGSRGVGVGGDSGGVGGGGGKRKVVDALFGGLEDEPTVALNTGGDDDGGLFLSTTDLLTSTNSLPVDSEGDDGDGEEPVGVAEEEVVVAAAVAAAEPVEEPAAEPVEEPVEEPVVKKEVVRPASVEDEIAEKVEKRRRARGGKSRGGGTVDDDLFGGLEDEPTVPSGPVVGDVDLFASSEPPQPATAAATVAATEEEEEKEVMVEEEEGDVAAPVVEPVTTTMEEEDKSDAVTATQDTAPETTGIDDSKRNLFADSSSEDGDKDESTAPARTKSKRTQREKKVSALSRNLFADSDDDEDALLGDGLDPGSVFEAEVSTPSPAGRKGKTDDDLFATPADVFTTSEPKDIPKANEEDDFMAMFSNVGSPGGSSAAGSAPRSSLMSPPRTTVLPGFSSVAPDPTTSLDDEGGVDGKDGEGKEDDLDILTAMLSQKPSSSGRGGSRKRGNRGGSRASSSTSLPLASSGEGGGGSSGRGRGKSGGDDGGGGRVRTGSVSRKLAALSEMAHENDLYRIMGVSPSTSDSKLAAAFKSLQDELDPNRFDSRRDQRRASARFTAINTAYVSVLSHKKKRSLYNTICKIRASYASVASPSSTPKEGKKLLKLINKTLASMSKAKMPPTLTAELSMAVRLISEVHPQ